MEGIVERRQSCDVLRRVRMGAKGTLLRWLHGTNPHHWGDDPADFDADAVASTLARLSGPVFGPRGWFRVEARGFERIPAGPVMVVSNHSGGTSIPDVWGFLWLWYRAFGTSRPLHPSAHEMILSAPAIARWCARRGVVRADPTLARAVLTEWRRDLMVMPGGDLDTWRPWSRRYEVEFGGRLGYARTALRARVPVVPVAHAGAHETLMVLTDGRRFAELVGLQRVARAAVWPVHLSLPWGLAIGPWPHLPTPATLRYRVGEPIAPPASLTEGAEPDDDMVRDLDARIRESVQSMLYELRDERAKP